MRPELMESTGEILGRGQAGKGSREGRKEPHRGRRGGSSGSPSTLPPPAGALPFGRSRVWKEAEPRRVQPSREMGGTAASQKTETGGWKQVGNERAGRVLGWGCGGRRGGREPIAWGQNPWGRRVKSKGKGLAVHARRVSDLT